MTEMKSDKRILLHSCCGPCSTAVIERLVAEGYELTVLFANANITDQEEYQHRLSEQKRFLIEFNQTQTQDRTIELIEGNYDTDQFLIQATGMESEPEGGERCNRCFSMRLAETADLCSRLGMTAFATTLSVSPHKNVNQINRIGEMLARESGVEFLPFDFKKKNGYLRSIQLSKEHDLYRQEYCGCQFSKR